MNVWEQREGERKERVGKEGISDGGGMRGRVYGKE